MIKSYIIPAACTLVSFVAVANWVPAKEKITPGEFIDRQEDPFDSRDGRTEANRMRKEGRLGIVAFGMPVPWISDYRQILLTEYQIEYRAIAGCVVSEEIVNYARDFNAVMDPVIKDKFGAEIFENSLIEARLRFQDRRNAEESVNQI